MRAEISAVFIVGHIRSCIGIVVVCVIGIDEVYDLLVVVKAGGGSFLSRVSVA